MRVLHSYPNGNYQVTIYSNGTKVRENDLDFFRADFPENIDIKITNQCDMGCSMCHEDSTPDGIHGDILNPAFLDSLHTGTELAIGGGNPLCHPDFVTFLLKMYYKKIICNVTVNQAHFMQHYDTLKRMCDNRLIWGLGVSVSDPYPELIEKIKTLENAVIHVINGIITEDALQFMENQGLKMLILGYKDLRRGHEHLQVCDLLVLDYQNYMKHWLKEALADKDNKGFKVISFDNLALEQLDVKNLVSPDVWSNCYMGNDGQHTMYVDMVNQECAMSSTTLTRFPLHNTIEEMFNQVRTDQ